MNLQFGKSHLKTLSDLQKIAKKHNSNLTFGIETSNGGYDELEKNLLVQQGVNKRTIEILHEQEYLKLEHLTYTYQKLWFEIYDKTKDEYSTLAYIEQNLYFEIDNEAYLTDISEEDNQLLKEFKEQHQNECGDFYSFSDHPTIIKGFGSKKITKDYRVYRPGLALKFFSDLVCDYFTENRIEKTY
jgi:hypothetical protein